MNLQSYLLKRQQQGNLEPFRKLCLTCMQPDFTCYCEHIKNFDPVIKFVILIHPLEAKRRIATGRMSHLCLKHSELILGQNYSRNDKLNNLLSDGKYDPMILYPGRKSRDISQRKSQNSAPIFAKQKIPLLLVVDGTWGTAKKTMNQSVNLQALPRICFTPPGLSQFRVRKQPAPECYSTIEAIHYALELIGKEVGFAVEERKHDSLLHVFEKMVERQLEFIRISKADGSTRHFRRLKSA